MRTSATIAAILFLTVLPVTLVTASDRPDILVIDSYHEEYHWSTSRNTALREGLSGVADLTFHYLDVKRLSPKQHPTQTASALELYRNIRPSLVILADDAALAYLGRTIADMGTPVVFLGVNANPRKYVGTTELVTGVLERPLIKRSIVFINDILGTPLHKCMVLFDNGITANAVLETVFGKGSSAVVGTTHTDIVLTNTFEQWKTHVLGAKKKGYGAIILGLYHILSSEDGKNVPGETVARWTSEHSPVPIFAFWDFAVGRGKALGGLVLTGRSQGKLAVGLAKRILAGEPPGDVHPLYSEQGLFLFSHSELKRWGISLPPNLVKPTEILEFVD